MQFSPFLMPLQIQIVNILHDKHGQTLLCQENPELCSPTKSEIKKIQIETLKTNTKVCLHRFVHQSQNI